MLLGDPHVLDHERGNTSANSVLIHQDYHTSMDFARNSAVQTVMWSFVIAEGEAVPEPSLPTVRCPDFVRHLGDGARVRPSTCPLPNLNCSGPGWLITCIIQSFAFGYCVLCRSDVTIQSAIFTV